MSVYSSRCNSLVEFVTIDGQVVYNASSVNVRLSKSEVKFYTATSYCYDDSRNDLRYSTRSSYFHVLFYKRRYTVLCERHWQIPRIAPFTIPDTFCRLLFLILNHKINRSKDVICVIYKVVLDSQLHRFVKYDSIVSVLLDVCFSF